MEIVVVDSDVIIDYSHGYKEPLMSYLLKQTSGDVNLVVPTFVVYEFYSGYSLSDPALYETTEKLFSRFSVQALTEEIAKRAAKLNRERKVRGQIEQGDILIAATTIILNGSLLTRNRKHFSAIPRLRFA